MDTKEQTLSQIALVTGANRGIGLEVCRQLAQRGMTVILSARDLGKAESAAQTLRDDVNFEILRAKFCSLCWWVSDWSEIAHQAERDAWGWEKVASSPGYREFKNQHNCTNSALRMAKFTTRPHYSLRSSRTAQPTSRA